MNEKNETDLMRAQTKTLNQLDAEHANDVPAGSSLPVIWKDGATGKKMKGRPLTVVPTEEEVARLSSPRAATCGTCKYYDLEGGRKEIIEQRFLERLVQEEQWKVHHLGDISSAGVCRERPSMVVTYVSSACESYRQREVRR